MTEELKELLFIIVFAAPVGIIAGIIFRKMYPAKCKSYAKYTLSKQWKLFLSGSLMFLVFAIMSFWSGRVIFGTFFLIFSCLELFALLKYGVKNISPEQEAAIDSSDPTKLRPFRFWK